MSSNSFSEGQIKEKFKKISSSKDFVSISANMFHDNQDSVQNFKTYVQLKKTIFIHGLL